LRTFRKSAEPEADPSTLRNRIPPLLLMDDDAAAITKNDDTDTYYDVVICGTGLVESILSAALTMQHLKVLHVDSNDYYGQMDASMNLKDMMEWCERHHCGGCESESEGEGRVGAIDGNTNDNNDNANTDSMGGVCASSLRLHSYTSSTGTGSKPLSNDHDHSHYCVGQKVMTKPYGAGVIVEYDSHSNSNNGHTANSIGDNDNDNITCNTTSPTSSPSSSLSVSRMVVELTSWTTLPSAATAATVSFQWSAVSNIKNQVLSFNQVRLRNVISNPRWNRQVAFDLSGVAGGILLSQGSAVHALIRSNVADYLEFKPLQSLQVLLNDNGDSGSATSVATSSSSSYSLTPVPCRKGDVFSSTLLKPLEKRKLMKLLQLVLEYEEYQYQYCSQSETAIEAEANRAQAEAEVDSSNNTAPSDTATSTDTNTAKTDTDNTTGATASNSNSNMSNLNERKIQRVGMSLVRPQNKRVAKSALDKLVGIIQDAQNADSSESSTMSMSFSTYLQQQQKLSPSMTIIVVHALGLSVVEGHKISVAQGFHLLSTHLSSLGKFGATAFIAPLYGTGELAQAFCRKAAVLNATYMLRQRLQTIQTTTGSTTSTNKKVITGVELVSSPDREFEKEHEQKEHEQEHSSIQCRHVVVSRDSVSVSDNGNDNIVAAPPSQRSRILHRVSLLYLYDADSDSGDNIDNMSWLEPLQQSLIVVPPSPSTGDDGAGASTFISLKNHAMNVCPPGYMVVHMSTTVVDDVDADDTDMTMKMKTTLHQVLQSAKAKATANNGGGDSTSPSTQLLDDMELYHVCYSVLQHSQQEEKSCKSPCTVTSTSTIAGLHVVPRPTLAISVDQAFDVAKDLFHDIMTSVNVSLRGGDTGTEDNSKNDNDNAHPLETPTFLEMAQSLQDELDQVHRQHLGGGNDGGNDGEGQGAPGSQHISSNNTGSHNHVDEGDDEEANVLQSAMAYLPQRAVPTNHEQQTNTDQPPPSTAVNGNADGSDGVQQDQQQGQGHADEISSDEDSMLDNYD
jgi:RAB protein geranylgeranyltransferase component A